MADPSLPVSHEANERESPAGHAPSSLHLSMSSLQLPRFEPKIVRTIVMLFAFEIAVMMRMSFPGDGGDDGTW